jgi:nucleoid-associated protein YgaU
MFERGLDLERMFGQDGRMGRTYVRRRWTAGTVVVVAAVVLSAPVAGALARHREPPPPARTYVVRAGDTLWSIAERLGGGGDPRPLIDAIADRNGIDPGSIVPGQTILIPTAG